MKRLTNLKPRLSQQPDRLKSVNPDSWRQGKTSTQRGYGYRWQQARERYLMDHPLCVFCERRGLVTAASVVDHKVAHHGDQALFWDQDNWQALCKPCHDSEKQKLEAAGLVD